MVGGIGGRGIVPTAKCATDSRTLAAGRALRRARGPNSTAGEFVAAAAERGRRRRAGGEAPRPACVAQIVVSDTLARCSELAPRWRARSRTVVGLGGSNGKTTAKEMTAAILSRMGPCMATRGNLNNHIGVPLTLMRLESSHRSAVVEMGANRIGDVADWFGWRGPTVGFITNAGAEHLEGFGTLDGVAQARARWFPGSMRARTAIINADDVYAGYWRSVATAAHRHFRRAGRADFMAKGPQSIERGEFATRFKLQCPFGEARSRSRRAVRTISRNALAAAAAAGAAGRLPGEIAPGFGFSGGIGPAAAESRSSRQLDHR